MRVRGMMAVAVLLMMGLGTTGFKEANTHHGPKGKWELLGSRKVNFGLDVDVIQVGAVDGSFSKLKMVVKNGALNLHKMQVIYGDGSIDNLTVKHSFQNRSSSRLIDLQGDKRIIKKIKFWYDTKNRSRNRASVMVYGRH